jgi:hypothetical protein
MTREKTFTCLHMLLVLAFTWGVESVPAQSQFPDLKAYSQPGANLQGRGLAPNSGTLAQGQLPGVWQTFGPFANPQVKHLISDPQNDEILYLGLRSLAANDLQGVYRTINRGISWEPVGAPLNFARIQDLLVEPDVILVSSFNLKSAAFIGARTRVKVGR